LTVEAKVRPQQIQSRSDIELFVQLQEVAQEVGFRLRDIEWVDEYYRALVWRLRREVSKHSTNVVNMLMMSHMK